MAKPEFLGNFEQLLLLAILRLDGEAYGVSVRREIERCTGRSITIGAVYATLDRLEEKGLVSSWMAEPTNERGGRAKRLFRVEPRGAASLRNTLNSTRAMLKGLEKRWDLL